MVFSACCNESDNMPSSSEVKNESMGLVSDSIEKRPYPKFSVINNARETDILTSDSQERLDGLVFGLTKLPFARRNGTAQARESVENLETKEVYTSWSSSGFSSKDSSSGSSSSGSLSPASTTTVPEAQTQQVLRPPLSPKPNLTGCDVRLQAVSSPQGLNSESMSSLSSKNISDASGKLEKLLRTFIREATTFLHEQCETANNFNLKNLPEITFGAMTNKIVECYNKVTNHYTILKDRGFYYKSDFNTLTRLHIMTKSFLGNIMDGRRRYRRALGQSSSFVPLPLTCPPPPPSTVPDSIQGEKYAFTPIAVLPEQTVLSSPASICESIQGEKSVFTPIMALSGQTVHTSSSSVCTLAQRDKGVLLPTDSLSEQAASTPSSSCVDSKETVVDHSMESSPSSMSLHAYTLSIRSPQLAIIPIKLQNLSEAVEMEQIDNESQHKQGEKLQTVGHAEVRVEQELDLSSISDDYESCQGSFILDKEVESIFLVPYLNSSYTEIESVDSMEQSSGFFSPVSIRSKQGNSTKKRTLTEQISSMLETPSPTRPSENQLALSISKQDRTTSQKHNIADLPTQIIVKHCSHSQISPQLSVPKRDIEKNTSTFFDMPYFPSTVTTSSSRTVNNRQCQLSTTMIADSSLGLGSSSMCPPTSEYAQSHPLFKECCGSTSVIHCSDALLTPPSTPSSKHSYLVCEKQYRSEQISPPATPDSPIMKLLPTSYTTDKHIVLPRFQKDIRAYINPSVVKVLHFDSFSNAIPSIQEEISSMDLHSSTVRTITKESSMQKEISLEGLCSFTTTTLTNIELLESACHLLVLSDEAVSDKDRLSVSSCQNESMSKGPLIFPQTRSSETVAQFPASHFSLVEVDLRVNSRGEREEKGVGNICGRVSPPPTSTKISSSTLDCVLETKTISENLHPEKSSDLISRITGRNNFKNHFEIQERCSLEKYDRNETIEDIFAVENNIEHNDDLENSLSCSNDRLLREIFLRHKISKRKANLQKRKKEFFETDLKQLKEDQLARWISQSRSLYNNTDQLFDELEKLEVYSVEDCESRLVLEEDSLEILDRLAKARETRCTSHSLPSSTMENNRTSTLLNPIDFTRFDIPQLKLSSPLENFFNKANSESSVLVSKSSVCPDALNAFVELKDLFSLSLYEGEMFGKESDFLQKKTPLEKPETTQVAGFALVIDTLLLTKLFISSIQEVLSFAAILTLKAASKISGTAQENSISQKDSITNLSPTKTVKSHQTSSGLIGSKDCKRLDIKNTTVRREVIADIVSLLHFQRVNNRVLRSSLLTDAVNCPQSSHPKIFKTSSRKKRLKKNSSARKSSLEQVPVGPLLSGFTSSSEKFYAGNSSLNEHSRLISPQNYLLRKHSSKQRPNNFQTQKNVRHTLPSRKSTLPRSPAEVHPSLRKTKTIELSREHQTEKSLLWTYPLGNNKFSNCSSRNNSSRQRPNKLQKNSRHTLPSRASPPRKSPLEMHLPFRKIQRKKFSCHHCTTKDLLQTSSATKSAYLLGNNKLSDPEVRKDIAKDTTQYLTAHNKAKLQKENNLNPSLGLKLIISSSDVLR